MSDSKNYDSIIIGAGHNGLVCAAYLAKQGQRVLILESSEAVGGLAASREIHPGFHVSVAHSVGHFSRQIAKDLQLDRHGYKSSGTPLPTVGLSTDGNHQVLSGGSLTGANGGDTASFQDYAKLMQRFADMLEPFWMKKMPRIGFNSIADVMTFAHVGLNLRMLGKQDMQEFLRIVSLPTRDLMDEYFENDVLKTMLNWDGLVGSRLAPRSPNSAVFAMLYRLAGDHSGAHVVPQGGVAGLIAALAKSAQASGAEIRTGAAVARILTQPGEDGLSVHGVQLQDGERIEATRVVSSADPKTTFLNLLGVENLEIEFTNRIRRLRCDGLVAKLHLALSDLPKFTGLDRPDGRMIIAPNLDAMEFAFDDAKYGDCPERPVMEVVIPSLREPGLTPEGQHVLSAHVMYVPYRLKGGWTATAREVLCERAIDVIEQYAPGIRDHIVHREVLTPFDLEQQFHVTGGHWHHTEMALDQLLMMRPTYEAAQYSTPLPGLYLCGAGSHPGGDIMGGPGHNAACEILR